MKDRPRRVAVPVTEWAVPPRSSPIIQTQPRSSSSSFHSHRSPILIPHSPTKSKSKRSPSPSHSPSFDPSNNSPLPIHLLNTTNFLSSTHTPTSLATQIHLFHLDRLAAISGQSCSSRHLLRTATVFLASTNEQRAKAMTPIFTFGAGTPHFLSRVVVSTILPSTSTSAHPSPSTSPTPPHAFPSTSSSAPPPLSAEVRASSISKWIHVGQILKQRGDAVGWTAIATALCCRAISRLEESWRIVDKDLVGVVRREWSLELSRKGFSDLEESSVDPVVWQEAEEGTGVPYLGTVLAEVVSALKSSRVAQEGLSGGVDLVPLYEIRGKLDRITEVWTREAPMALRGEGEKPDPEIQYLFQTLSRAVPPLGSKASLAAYLPLSLDAERPTPIPQHISLHLKPRSSTDPNPLVPLIMVEPLPHISLIDRDSVLQSAALSLGQMPRKQSATSLSPLSGRSTPTPTAAPPGRLVRRNSYPPSALLTVEKNKGNLSRLREEILSNSDTLLRFAEGDVVFRIISTAIPAVVASTSMASEMGLLSRTSSWVESKSSRASRASIRSLVTSSRTLSPMTRSASKRESTNSSKDPDAPAAAKLQVAGEEEPVNVVVKAGTVEALCDLLVLGIGNFRMPSKDADGVSSLTQGKRPLAFDIVEYRSCFFAMFRSFSTPLAIFDLLRKRYVAAPNASKEYVNLSSTSPFPSWSMAPSSGQEDDLDWPRITTIRLAVLENLRHWIENEISDFLDDDDLFTSASTFLLGVVTTERAALRTRPDEDESVLELAQRLHQRLIRTALRPHVHSRELGTHSNAEEQAESQLSFDDLTAAQLVDHLDTLAVLAAKDVCEHDLVRYLNVLESSLLADPSAWYSTRHVVKTDDEDLIITDPYSQILAMGSDLTVLKAMPLSLQHTVRVHTLLRRWVLGHLVDPELPLARRQTRMIKAIEMIEISRSRVSNVFFGGQAEALTSIREASLASFVERAVTAAVVAPESRLFASAWSGVASTRKVPLPDSLASLVKPDPLITDATTTLDLAWLNERLVEITTQVDSLSEGISINFDKRYWMFNCIRNAVEVYPTSVADGGRVALLQIEQRLTGWGNWSFRVLRDVALGEGTKLTKSVKPFKKLVDQQQEKSRRDRHLREAVSKGLKLEQLGRIQREKEVARAMDKSVGTRTRRMTSIWSKVRPNSTLSTSHSLPVAPVTASPSSQSVQALHDWVPTTKPFLVLALSGAEVETFENTQRSFVFELRTEDGQKSLFQAATADEMHTWTTNLRNCGSQIAHRRATFLAQSPLAEEVHEFSAPPVERSSVVLAEPVDVTSTIVYGVPLYQLVQKEGGLIPGFLDMAFKEVEERGLTEVGIYRISGENRVIQDTKAKIDAGQDVSSHLSSFDIHNITGLIKMFLRELPEPLIPFDFYAPFLEANAIQEFDDRLYAIRDLVWSLPSPNFHLLRRLTEHLDRITDHEDVNSMHSANLAIVFAPNLLQPPPGPSSFALSMTNLGKAVGLVKQVISQTAWIFSEEQEAEETAGGEQGGEQGGETAKEEGASDAVGVVGEGGVGLGLEVPDREQDASYVDDVDPTLDEEDGASQPLDEEIGRVGVSETAPALDLPSLSPLELDTDKFFSLK
ncbi:hypothetical protein T439DRAFT_309052 [Meredithblackwellia eburnea MCA 4105]